MPLKPKRKKKYKYPPELVIDTGLSLLGKFKYYVSREGFIIARCVTGDRERKMIALCDQANYPIKKQKEFIYYINKTENGTMGVFKILNARFIKGTSAFRTQQLLDSGKLTKELMVEFKKQKGGVIRSNLIGGNNAEVKRGRYSAGCESILAQDTGSATVGA